MTNSADSFALTYACGHIVVKLKRPSRPSVQDLYVRSAARRLCDSCTQKHEEVRISMLEAAVTRSNNIVAETVLRGSKKQVEWADRLRNTSVANVFEFRFRDVPSMTGTRANFKRVEDSSSPEAIERALTNILAASISAIEEALKEDRSWVWIDDRENDFIVSIVNKRSAAAIKSQISILTKEVA